MSKPTPTSRTLDLLRREGWLAQVVEQWLPRCRLARDLFHFGDVLAVRPEAGVLVVQATPTTTCRIAWPRPGMPELRIFLAVASCRFEVWGWRKRAGKWEVRASSCPAPT